MWVHGVVVVKKLSTPTKNLFVHLNSRSVGLTCEAKTNFSLSLNLSPNQSIHDFICVLMSKLMHSQFFDKFGYMDNDLAIKSSRFGIKGSSGPGNPGSTVA